MNDPVRPSALFGGPRSPAAAPAGVLATVPNPPPEIAQLAVGTTLRGVVSGHDREGHLLVRTALGTLPVATKAQPPVGTEVTLQIRASGAQLHVLLMHSDAQGPPGRGATPGPAQSGHAPAPGSTTTPAAPETALDLLTLGRTLRAVVQTPSRAPLATPVESPMPAAARPTVQPDGTPGRAVPEGVAALARRLVAGQELQLRLISVEAAARAAGPNEALPPTAGRPQSGVLARPTAGPGVQGHGPPASGTAGPPRGPAAAAGAPVPPAAPPAGVTGAPAPERPAHQGPAAAGPAHTASRAIASYLASGGTQNAGGRPPAGAQAATATASAGPAAVQPAATDPAAAPRFSGTVTGATPAGHPILRTPLGTLTLEARTAVPVGARLTLEVQPQAPRAAAPGGLPAAAAAPGMLAHAWPALEQAVQALGEPSPAGAAAQAVAEALPQPGPRLASGLLFFLAALGAGELSRWLGGPAIQALKAAGRDSLLVRLGQDFAQLSRLADGAGGEWRMVFLPLLDGDQLQQLRLFLRHGHDQGDGAPGEEKDDEPTRFVLEVELSRLGDLQLDGLVRPRRFDLILRTRAQLPQDMRRDISRIFHEANEASGCSGNIAFQASKTWRCMPIGTAAGRPPDLVV